MGLVELLLGVVFATGLAFGIGLGAIGDAVGAEFWVARGSFIISALATTGAYFWWLRECPRRRAHAIVLGVIAFLWLSVALPAQLAWIGFREQKVSATEKEARSASLPTVNFPDVTVRLVYPDHTAIVLVNNSDAIAKEIKWTVVVWNLDDPRTYLSTNPGPNSHDPLPIPVSMFDFLRPHSSGGPQTLFARPDIREFAKDGQRLFGSMSVICPDCKKGHTYFVYEEIGKGGWYSEVADVENGELVIPQHLTKDLVQQYYKEALERVPESARISISAR